MAYPFGGHPRFDEYIQWAVGQGCICRSGVRKVRGRSVTSTLLQNPANERHVISVVEGKTFLVPTMVHYFDRRLGLDSPFPKIDPNGY